MGVVEVGVGKALAAPRVKDSGAGGLDYGTLKLKLNLKGRKSLTAKRKGLLPTWCSTIV